MYEIIPATWRKPLYVIYALIGVALGAIATAFGPENVPGWHAVTTNVVLYIGGAFGLTAAANTLAGGRQITGDEPVVEEDDDADEPADEVEDDALEDMDPADEVGVPNVHDVAQAEDQAALDAALLEDQDDTPPREGWTPQH